jgi:cobaltochelatase CobN
VVYICLTLEASGMTSIPAFDSDLPTCNAQTVKLQQTIADGLPVVTRRDSVLGQLIFCEGCCCGRKDRGFPAWPRDLVKARWKELKLNSTIQLTISGCLGPCDVANVVCMMPAVGDSIWLGGLSRTSQYEQLITWAESCRGQQRLLNLPATFDPFRFTRFANANGTSQGEEDCLPSPGEEIRGVVHGRE